MPISLPDFATTFAAKRAAIFLAALLFSGGCAREPRAPNTLRLLQKSDVSSLDPAAAYDTYSMSLVRVLYRGLVDYGEGTEFVNALASTRSISSDGLTYSFKLRRDARFHFDANGQAPGRRVVAEDVRYQLERVLDPTVASDGFTFFQGIAGAGKWGEERKRLQNELSESSTSAARKKEVRKLMLSRHVPGITVRGDDEITIRLEKRDSTFLNLLALPFAYPVPREWVEKIEGEGLSLKSHPNGCGPFRLATWTPDSFLRVEKNPDFYDKRFPKADAVEYRIGGDDTLALMRFENGDADLQSLEDTPGPDFLRVTRDAKWRPLLQHAPMMDVRYLCINTEMKPFDNALVRRAFNHAIDKKTIQKFLAGRAVIARGVLPPGLPAYDEALPMREYSPQKARELLSQAGLKNGFKTTLWYSSSPEWTERAAQSIKQNLSAVGIALTLKRVAFAELKSAAGKRGNIPLSINGWVQDFPDPSNYFGPLLAGKSRQDTGSTNRAFYANARVDALLAAALGELDQSKRTAMYREAERIAMNDAPWVPLLHTERYVLRQPWVSGYKLHPMWSMRLEHIGVAR